MATGSSRSATCAEALTGVDTAEGALALAQDCLVAGLGTYADGRHPRPSRPQPDVRLIALPPLVAAKLALHRAMRDQGLNAATLAADSGMAETALRRLLDLGHRSHIKAVEAPLRRLGRPVELVVEMG